MAEEKSFAPSEKKLKKGREEGKVLKGQHVSQVAGMIGVLVGLSAILIFKKQTLLELVTYAMTQGFTSPTHCLKLFIMEFVVIGLVSLGCGALAGFAAELGQIGFWTEVGLLAPKAERLDPVAGVKKLFSGFKDLGIVFAKAIILAIVCYNVISVLIAEAPVMITRPDPLAWGMQMISRVIWQVIAALIVIAAFDYLIAWRRFYKEMSMSHQDMKEEYKEDDGDPHMKHARKSMHHELLFQDMVARVRRANVIVVKRA